MNKRITSNIITFTLILISFSCSKIDSTYENENSQQDKQYPKNISTSLNIAYTPQANTNSSKITWQNNDTIKLVGYNNSLQYQGTSNLIIITGHNNSNGKFKGKLIDGASKYHIYYPCSVKIDNNGNPSLDMSGQKQCGNNNTEHLKNYILLGTETPTNISETFKLKQKSCVMKFVLTNIPKETGKLRQLIWHIDKQDNTIDSLTLNFDTTPSNAIIFSETNTTLTAYIGFMPNQITLKQNGIFKVTLKGDTDYQSIGISNANVTYNPQRRYTSNMGTFKTTTNNNAVFNYKFGYETLPETEKKMYDLMVKSVLNFPAHSKTSTRNYAFVNFGEIGLPDKNSFSGIGDPNAQLFNRLITIINADEPKLYNMMLSYRPPRWVENNKPYYAINLLSSPNQEEYNTQMAQINAIADEMCKDITPNTSDFDKFKIIHDNFLKYTAYGSITAGSAGSIYGGFIQKKAVCEGFARSILFLCQKVGIKAIYVVGALKQSNNTWIAHAWNHICINGKWYFIDPTTDNGLATNDANGTCGYKTFLLGKNHIPDTHEYCLVDTQTKQLIKGSNPNYYYPELPALELENCPGSDECRNYK